MVGTLIESAVCNAIAAAFTWWAMQYIGMGYVDLSVSAWYCAACASAFFLVDLWDA